MDEGRVALASVGLGWWGSVLAEAATTSGKAAVTTCYARTGATREAFAAKHGCRPVDRFEALLEDPSVDGLLVATPHSTHEELVTAAVEAGKHVLVEKPLALTVEAGRRMVDAAARAGVTLQVGHQRRKAAATRALREMAGRGELGDLHLLRGHMSKPSVKESSPADRGWRGDAGELPLGGMTSLGIHMVDNLLALAGSAQRVLALSRRLRPYSTVDDATALLIEFAAGPVGQVSTSLVLPDSATVEVFGTTAAAWSEDDGKRLRVQRVDEKAPRDVPVSARNPVVDQLAEFADCVRSGAEPEVGGLEALEVVAVLEAGMESAATGRAVTLPTLRRG